ncbi:Uncharacterized protein DAT39_011800, partial [Clarias magur]
LTHSTQMRISFLIVRTFSIRFTHRETSTGTWQTSRRSTEATQVLRGWKRKRLNALQRAKAPAQFTDTQ